MLSLLSPFAYPVVPELPPLSPEQEAWLQQQEISEAGPGTILHDFQVLLDFVGTRGLEVSSTHQLLPLKALAELNARMRHPLQIDLKRPQQKSYPHIHGLYLLLRTSGLARPEVRGKKQFLVLDPEALASWNRLNPTERYFNLLEAWLIWGHDEVLGELRSSSAVLENLSRCMRFWAEVTDKGKKVASYADQQLYGYYPGLHNLALLELFGFLSIQSVKPEAGKGWRFKALQRSPWGEAIFRCLYQRVLQELPWLTEEINFQGAEPEEAELEDAELEEPELEEPEIETIEAMFGLWQDTFQPWFPAWQHNLEIPEHEFQDGLYVFKVVLGKIWRRIAIPGSLTLEDLSYAILKSVDFDDDHLHRFSFKNRFGWMQRIHHSYMEEPPFTDEVRVGDVPLEPGMQMTYLFDFGAHWEFDVQLERIEPGQPEPAGPELLEGFGEAPEQYPAWNGPEDWEEEEEEDEA